MTDFQPAPLDVAAALVLEQAVRDLRAGVLQTIKFGCEDDSAVRITFEAGAGPVAVAAAERAAKVAAATERQAPAALRGPRPPGLGDVCPKCGSPEVRDAGGLDWICVGCQHSWAPFS